MFYRHSLFSHVSVVSGQLCFINISAVKPALSFKPTVLLSCAFQSFLARLTAVVWACWRGMRPHFWHRAGIGFSNSRTGGVAEEAAVQMDTVMPAPLPPAAAPAGDVLAKLLAAVAAEGPICDMPDFKTGGKKSDEAAPTDAGDEDGGDDDGDEDGDFGEGEEDISEGEGDDNPKGNDNKKKQRGEGEENGEEDEEEPEDQEGGGGDDDDDDDDDNEDDDDDDDGGEDDEEGVEEEDDDKDNEDDEEDDEDSLQPPKKRKK